MAVQNFCLGSNDILDGLSPEWANSLLDVGSGNLRVAKLSIYSTTALVVAFDYSKQLGSIGVAEATQIVNALQYARESNCAVILLFESSGIRVTDETAGIASLRKTMRAALDARIDGVRLLAVVQRSAFGGASLLAALCNRVLVHKNSIFSMSGPKLIERISGDERFTSADPELVRSLLGGGARVAISSLFQEVEGTASAFQDAIVAWAIDRAGSLPTINKLQVEQRSYEGRLAWPLKRPKAIQIKSSNIPDQIVFILASLFPYGLNLRSSENVLIAESHPELRCRVLALISPQGATARDVLVLTKGLLELDATGDLPSHFILLVDADSHSAQPEDEKVILSELLAHLAIAIRLLHRSGKRIDVVVAGSGGGGIQSALASGASSVSMTSSSRLYVLPKMAMEALNKSESADAGTISNALSVGAIDNSFDPETVIQRRSSHV